MVSTCDEFLITINEYPLNVISLSETRLKDNPALLDFVSVPGYSTDFRNRESIKGGGVGSYIRNDINFRRRKDIEDLQPDLEHLCVEIPGRNKHSKALVEVMYIDLPEFAAPRVPAWPSYSYLGRFTHSGASARAKHAQRSPIPIENGSPSMPKNLIMTSTYASAGTDTRSRNKELTRVGKRVIARNFEPTRAVTT